MQNTKLRVKIPDKCYDKKQNNNVYIYYHVSSYYNKTIKNTVNKRVLIGKKINNEPKYMHPNKNYYKYFTNDAGIEQIESDYGFCLNVGLHLIVDKLLKELNLADIFYDVFKDKRELVKSLIQYYISSRSTVSQHFSSWMFHNIAYIKSSPSSGTISNLFNKDISYETVHQFLNTWVNNVKHITNLENALISLDSTNINTNSSNISIAEYGKPKFDEGLPQINIFYALEQKTGMPIFYDLYPGSITDQRHMEMATRRSSSYGLKNLTFIMDRGYFSQKNIEYLEAYNYSYIFMASSHYRVLQDIFEKHKDKVKEKADTYLPFYDMYGLRIKNKIFYTGRTEGYIYIFYNPEKQHDELLNHRRYIKQAMTELKNVKVMNDGIMNTYGKLFDFDIDKNNKVVKFELNKERYQETIDNAGYYFMISDKKYELEEIIDIYKRRDIIEKMFKMIKSELDSSKLFATSKDALESKVLLTFIASIVRASIGYKAYEYLKTNSSATINTLVGELEKIQAIKRIDVYEKAYALTKKQKDILACFDLTEKDIDILITKINKALI